MGYRVLLGAATALLATSFATPVAAQTTFWACRVPAVGVLYMIADAAANCLDGAHVKFSWTDGGPPPDGSVTSAKIADGAVATADIADGAVTLPKLAVAPFLVTANNAGTGTTTSGTYVSAGSVTVNAPTAGRILVIVSAYCYVNNRDTLLAYGLGPTVGTITGGTLYCGWGDAAAASTLYMPVIAMEQYQVAAGSSTTIHAQALRFWGTGSVGLSGVRFRALFIPE